MKSLKLSVGFSSFCFALVAMLLANGLVYIFWQKDAVVREITSIERQIDLVHAVGANRGESTVTEVGNLLLQIGEEAGATCVYAGAGDTGIWLSERLSCRAALEKVIETALAEGTGKRIVNPALLPFVGSRAYVQVAKSFQAQGEGMRVLALSVPLQKVTSALWTQEKLIFVYLLVNALILSILFFFRFSRRALRPLDDLVELADGYQQDGKILLYDTFSGNEIEQLSRSIHAMLTRIDSDRQELEKTVLQLTHANKELQASREEMVQTEKLAVTGRLAAGLAHEIGNPLGIVGGYLELVKKEDIPWPEKQDYLKRVEGELKRIHGLVKQLVNCSRPTRSRQEHFHVQGVVEEVVTTLQHGKSGDGVDVTINFGAQDDHIVAEVDGVKQVILNCLLNALDAVRERYGEQGGKVTIATGNGDDQGGSYWQVTITDNGPGVPPDKQKILFDPFYTTKPPGKGTGLGLTVSRSLVDGYDGRLDFTSDGVHGSTVTLQLPLANALKRGEADV